MNEIDTVDKKVLFRIVKKLENVWAWNFLKRDSCGDPVFNTDAIISFIKNEIQIREESSKQK